MKPRTSSRKKCHSTQRLERLWLEKEANPLRRVAVIPGFHATATVRHLLEEGAVRNQTTVRRCLAHIHRELIDIADWCNDGYPMPARARRA